MSPPHTSFAFPSVYFSPNERFLLLPVTDNNERHWFLRRKWSPAFSSYLLGWLKVPGSWTKSPPFRLEPKVSSSDTCDDAFPPLVRDGLLKSPGGRRPSSSMGFPGGRRAPRRRLETEGNHPETPLSPASLENHTHPQFPPTKPPPPF